MLRCRVLSSPVRKVDGSSLQYAKQANFSNLPSSRYPSLRDDGFSSSDTQPLLSPDAVVRAELPLDTAKHLSAEKELVPDNSEGTDGTILRAETQTRGSKLAIESDPVADGSKETREKVETSLNSRTAGTLMQKLLELRTASRDILAVTKSAIKLATKDSQREGSVPVNEQQDGTTGLLLEGWSDTISQTTSSPTKPLPRTRKALRRRNRNNRGVIKGKDGTVIARKIATGSSETSAPTKASASKKQKQKQKQPAIKHVLANDQTAGEAGASSRRSGKTSAKEVKSSLLSARQLKLDVLDAREQPPVKTLSYDLDRVLFKQGVYNLQDARTGVFNFDHYLQNIMPAEEFDFDSLAKFMSSSEDGMLQDLARETGKKYVGSTSSMTSVLSHFHFLLSDFRPLNLGRISRAYPKPLSTFTEFTRIPASIFLRYKDGVYAVDSDKEFDRATILSRLGQSLEKLLTVPRDTYEQYRKTSPEKISEETKNTPEAYHYSSLANFVFRSQLDGRHDWLPGSGVFDIKTRACVTIRMDQDNYKQMSGYQIRGLYGEWESYEREYLDMLRSTMLKYSLQVRMGRMDGIFVAYHNTEQIFGFQYVPLSEMDLAIHGQENLALGDQEFNFSMQMFSDVLDLATERFPHQSIRFHFETRPRLNIPPEMYIFAEPMDTETMNTVQQAETAIAIQELRNEMLGEERPVNDDGEGLSVQSEDQNEQGHTQKDSTSDEFEEELTSEQFQEPNMPSLAAELQEVIPEADKPVPLEETEAAIEAEIQPTEIITEPVSSEEHSIESHPEATLNDEAVRSASLEEGVPQAPSTIFLAGKDEDLSLLELEAEQPTNTEAVLDPNEPNEGHSDRKSILGFSLTASHFINGEPMKAVPGIKYTSEWPIQQAQYRKGKAVKPPTVDKVWNVSYKIRQFTDDDAHRLYLACKARKRKKFEQLDLRDEFRDRYLRMMKNWSEKGRSHKSKADKVFSKDIKQVTP